MAGKPGRSGRRRNPRNALRYFSELYDQNAFELARVTIDKALQGDKEMLIYCHDRRMGRPKQETDLRVKGAIVFTAEDYELLTRPKADETRLIAQYSQKEE